MAKLAQVQQKGFADRLQRIQRGGVGTSGTLYMGAAESDGMVVSAASRRRRKKAGPMASLFMWVLALVIGAFAMFAGRAVTYHMTQIPGLLPEEQADLILLVSDFTIAAVLMILLGSVFRLGSGMRRVMLMAGFLSVMLGEGLIIQQAPDAFIPVFSEAYVTAQMRDTPPILTWHQTLADFQGTRILLPEGMIPPGLTTDNTRDG